MKNTYVKCANWTWEEKLLYIKACIGEDIPHGKICGNASYEKSDLLETYKNVAAYIYCYSNGMISFDEERDGLNSSASHGVEVNLSELKAEQEKPKRVKVSYVKHNVNEEGGKFWEVARDWSEGEPCVFHYFNANSYWSVADNDRLLKEYTNRNLYRKVEIEIDERQEFIDEALKLYAPNANELLGLMFDSGCRFTD